MRSKKDTKREKAVALIIVAVFSLFLINLFNVQIFESGEQKNAAVASVNVEVPALRGEIYDCNGYPLVTNKQVNTIVFNYLTFPSGSDAKGRNEVIDALIKLFDKHKIEWIDQLPIIYKKGKLYFDKERENEVSYLHRLAVRTYRIGSIFCIYLFTHF